MYGYHTHGRVLVDTTLWNLTARTKRGIAGKGGIVAITGPSISIRGKLYTPVAWGGHSGLIRCIQGRGAPGPQRHRRPR